MRRKIVLCVSVLLLFFLCSCGNVPTKEESLSAQQEQAIPEGDLQQSLDQLEAEESKQPTYEDLYDQGVQFLAAKKNTEAISAFQSAIAIDKPNQMHIYSCIRPF